MQIVTLKDEELESPSFSKAADTNKYIVGIGKHEDILISIFDMNAIVDEYNNYDRSRELHVYKKVGVVAMLANNICAYADTSLLGQMEMSGSIWDSAAYISEVKAYPDSAYSAGEPEKSLCSFSDAQFWR